MQFDNNTYTAESLGGWFSGFCPSNGIADRLNRQSRDADKQRKEFERKLENLKNAPAQHEIQQYETMKKQKEKELSRVKKELEQITQIAEVQGLGAWCNGAVKRRESAERKLKESQEQLGEAKERYNNLVNRHKNYLPRLRKIVDDIQNEINEVLSEIKKVKQRIEDKKKAELLKQQAEQMRINKEKLQAEASASVQTAGFGGMSMNTLLLVGAVATVLFIRNSKK